MARTAPARQLDLTLPLTKVADLQHELAYLRDTVNDALRETREAQARQRVLAQERDAAQARVQQLEREYDQLRHENTLLLVENVRL